ncbi:MAG: sialidase family protein [Acidobacteria bacterium]|nr:sialidase family protein [Acidobacteriota bacterium]
MLSILFTSQFYDARPRQLSPVRRLLRRPRAPSLPLRPRRTHPLPRRWPPLVLASGTCIPPSTIATPASAKRVRRPALQYLCLNRLRTAPGRSRNKKHWDPARLARWQAAPDRIPLPTRPGDNPEHYHERHAIEAADSRLLTHIRNHNPANDREALQSESSDDRKSWSIPRPIGVWGFPSHLLRLRDGRLLMTYSYRRPPRGNHARLSTDHGRTWSNPFVLSDDGVGNLGYPSTVELPNGRLLTLWCESPHPGSHPAQLPPPPFSVLRLARWRLG